MNEEEEALKYLNETKSHYESIATEDFIIMSDGSKLKVLHSKTKNDPENAYTLLIVPGWGSVVLGWDDVLLEGNKYFNIIYVETREKGSSELNKQTKHDLDRSSTDIKEIIKKLKIDEENLILFGSCYGGLIIADGLAKEKYAPLFSVLIAPPIRVELPEIIRYTYWMIPAYDWIINPLKKFARWWIKKKKTESKEQAAKYIRVTEEADPKKWKIVGKHIARPKHTHVYEKVTQPVLLVAAEQDKMHDAEVTQKIHKLMEDVTYIDLATNKNTHSKPIVDTIKEHIKKLF